MKNGIKILIVLAVLSFVLAVIENLTGVFSTIVGAEGLSRASTNLALIAIALSLVFNSK